MESQVGQVILVVESDASPNVAQSKAVKATPRQSATGSEIKEKRPSINWNMLEKLPSTEAFNKWLKRKAAAGLHYSRKRSTFSWQGAKDYYGCLGYGCKVMLEVFFDSSSEDVLISHNGKQHKHSEKPHSGWGMPEKIKQEVNRLFRSGVTSTPEVDSQLREKGHHNYTLKQLSTYLMRMRRRSRNQEAVQEYSNLSVWSSGDRSSQESRLAEDPGSASPPPAEEAEFSDPSPPASPAAAPTAGSLGHSPRRRPPKAMNEATVKRLVDASIAARRYAYNPYSRFAVGAALLCADGQIVTGCNVENASFGLTNCAERTAVFKAVAEGRRQFHAVAIAAEMGDTFVGPCGACRQVLAEFNAEMPVILAKPNGETKRTNMKELLPMAFLPDEVPFKKQ